MDEDISMVIKYWGVRGSIPAPLTTEQIRAKEKKLFSAIRDLMSRGKDGTRFIDENRLDELEGTLGLRELTLSGTYGGNTTCVEIQAKDSPLIIIDAGTGIRGLGKSLMELIFSDKQLNPLNSDESTKRQIHLFFTHYHWDHLQGFPFFGPTFIKGVNINFYGKMDTRKRLSEVLAGQQQYPNFPVEWDDLPCEKEYHEMKRLCREPIHLGKTTIQYQELTHPDSVFAYSFECNGKKFVFASDTEHKDIPDPRLIRLAEGADMLYYDAQYTPEEYMDPKFPKLDWGHSTYEWAVRNALAANAKVVVLGHHEPTRDDFDLDKIHERAVAFKNRQLKLPENKGKSLSVAMTYEGLEQRL